MKNYLNLLHFEFNRFWKLYVFLLSFTIVSQIAGVVWMSLRRLGEAQEKMIVSQMTVTQYAEMYGKIGFRDLLYSAWFQLPVFLSIAVLMIYVFFIWYRDWFAKGSFIYRLLMLPTARMNIYFAKLTTIMLQVLGLVALQTLLIQLGVKVFNAIIPVELREEIPVRMLYNYDFLDWLYPTTIMSFILLYGVGLLFVAVIFTCILLERSYGWKGIILAIVYVAMSIAIFIAPSMFNSFTNYLYPLELLAIMIVVSVVLLSSAIWLSGRLLTNKIKV
ncbi:MAG: hypothetical protein ABS949_13940 [Solibacillus sp.]